MIVSLILSTKICVCLLYCCCLHPVEIGYGPSTTDGPGGDHRRPASGKGGKRYNDIPENFHPPPPPSTKGTYMCPLQMPGTIFHCRVVPLERGSTVEWSQ